MSFNPHAFRQAFPYFSDPEAAVYLDNAATTLKPQVLIDATTAFYRSAGSVHRSQYDAAQTRLFEQARQRVAARLNVPPQAVVWTSGTTHAINVVANGLLPDLSARDEIIISAADHHANFVTWQQTAQKSGARLHVLPLRANGLIDETALLAALNSHTKLVALNMVSNVTGTAQPVAHLIRQIRRHSSALVLLDAAQAAHQPLNLTDLDADFAAFSAHKLYGPTGLGILSGKLTALSRLQPLMFGGKMVERVTAEATTFAELPYRLEAGTPNIAAVIGFNAVLAWLDTWDYAAAARHAANLAEQARVRLKNYPNCRLFEAAPSEHAISETALHTAPIVAFAFDGVNPFDLATLLGEQGIALRTGEHCAQPYLAWLKVAATLRLSFAPYNTADDLHAFFTALDKALELLS